MSETAAPPKPPKPPKRKRNGRPGPGRGHKLEPTKQQRDAVQTAKMFGMTDEMICRIAFTPPIDVKTLRKHFEHELTVAQAYANSQVARSIYLQAVGAPAEYDDKGNMIRAEKDRVPSCGIWWSKVHMGWREPPHRQEITGKDGAPLIDLSKLTDAELDLYEKLVRKSALTGPDTGGTESTRH